MVPVTEKKNGLHSRAGKINFPVQPKKFKNKKKNEVYEDASSTSSKSTFSPNILSPMNITIIPITPQTYHGIPNPAGMYPNTTATIATKIA